MLRRHVKSRRGFTISEILIALMVITIALLGTIAAIAYGLRASKLGGDNTVAIQVNRKVFELMLQAAPGLSPTDPTFAGIIGHAPASPTLPRIATPTAGNPWRPIWVPAPATSWFLLSDYGYTAGTPDADKFILETDRFQLDISNQGTNAVTGSNALWVANNSFQVLVVQTRWQDKNSLSWKVVRTEGYGLAI